MKGQQGNGKMLEGNKIEKSTLTKVILSVSFCYPTLKRKKLMKTVWFKNHTDRDKIETNIFTLKCKCQDSTMSTKIHVFLANYLIHCKTTRRESIFKGSVIF